ncbi:ribonuclease E/G [Halolamina salina]
MTEETADSASNVRVRGIYATALTRALLDAGHRVVQASPPIERRFDADLPAADHDAAIETGPDRQGVNVAGEPDAVESVRELLADTGIDTLAWTDPAPVGAVFDGRVTETLGSGAVVELGETAGFLPYRNVDGTVDDGETVRVQVVEAAAPWDDDRAVLDTGLRVEAGLATLVRGREGVRVAGRDDAAGRELAGLTDLLDTEPPEGWGLEWARDARDAEMGTLGDALERANERAGELERAVDDAGDPEPVREVASPTAGAWLWFGRESRFALDGIRREVTATMPGHHRTKAGTEAASAGVDFAEALCGDDLGGEFPFAVVADQFGPHEGDYVRIDHGKPAGRRIVLGEGEVVERDDDGTLAVEREMTGGGTYDALGTRRESGDTALTKFREGRWWYPTTYRSADGEHKGTYVNVCTPVELFPDSVCYVDLHVDVIKQPDGTVERVDDDELDAAVEAGELSEELAEKARSVASSIERAI